jgi:membrane-associated phospholipid phosphatase
VARGLKSTDGTHGWFLPIFLTPEMKWPAGMATFTAAVVLYLAANHIHLFPPQLLPLSWVDQVTPFLPNTVWIYVSEYLFFFFIYHLCRDMVNTNKYLYSFLTLQILSVTIFWLWPTTYPRDQFPLPADLNWFTYELFSRLRATDTPANCCPSLHVSSVFLSSFIFLDEQRKKFPFIFLWGVLISISTLTTKQHYLVDVVSGFCMAVILYWTFHKMIPYRPVVGMGGVHAKR